MKTRRSRLALAHALLAVLASVALLPTPGAMASTASPGPSASPSPVPSASGASGEAAEKPVVTFGIGPSTKGKVDRRSNYNVLAPRGGVVRDEVALVNLTLEPLTLNLYAADAVNGPDGAIGLEPAATKPVDAATWVTFATPTGKGYVVLKPRQTLAVPFTVTVPKEAEIGDHLAGVVASTVTQGQTPGERGTDISFEQRVAVRLSVRVAGELRPELSVENLTAVYAGALNPFGRGTAVVTYTVRNTGNVRLGGRQAVHVQGVVGPIAYADDVPDIPMLLPGGSATVSIPVPEALPLGLMTAAVTVVALAPAGDANPPSAMASGSSTFWAVPWTLLALILGLLLLAGWLWRRHVAPRFDRPAALNGADGRRARPGPDLVNAGKPTTAD